MCRNVCVIKNYNVLKHTATIKVSLVPSVVTNFSLDNEF